MEKTKLSLITLIFIFLINCELKNSTSNIKVTPSPISSIQEINPLDSHNPYIQEKYRLFKFNYKQNGEEKFCLPLDEKSIKVELKKPVDLAVTHDGKTIYVLNKQCDVKFKSEITRGDLLNKDCNYKSPYVERHFIFKINEDKKIEALKGSNVYSLSCQLGEEIEIDKNDNLIVSDSQEHIIYKITSGTAKKIADVTDYWIPGNKDEMPGPKYLYYHNDNLFYIMHKGPLSTFQDLVKIHKIDSKNKIIELARISSSISFLQEILDKYNKYVSSDPLEPAKIPFEILNPFRFYTPEMKAIEKLDTVYSIPQYIPIKLNSKKEAFMIFHNSILKYTDMLNNKVEVFAGNGNAGLKDGKGKEAEFSQPSNMSFDAQDNMYIADTGNNAIRKITPEGIVTTFYAQNQ